MRKLNIVLVIICSLAFANTTFAQENFGVEYSKTVKTGMYTLLGWSILNLGVGTYGNFQFEGQKKYFYQMNAGWNLVNFGLAASSFYSLNKLGLAEMDAASLFTESNTMGKVFLFNTGLDVGYMAFGAYLLERGKRLINPRFQGYGRSLMLQGAFLFAFDLVMYGVVNTHSKEIFSSMAVLEPSINGIGFVLRF